MKLIIYATLIPFVLLSHNLASNPSNNELMDYCKSRPEDSIQANIFFNKAEVFVDSVLYDSAILYYEKAATIYKKNKTWEKYIECRNHAFIQLCNKSGGHNLLSLAWENIKVAEKRIGANHVLTGHCYDNLGRCYSDRENVDSAIMYYTIAVEIWKNSIGEQSTDVARGYLDIGNMYVSDNNFELAEEFLMKGIQIYKEVEGPLHADVADGYNDLGRMYYFMGDYKTSAESLEKALEIKLQTLGENHPSVGDAYNNLAVIYSALNDFGKAIDCHKKSLNIKLTRLPKNHPEVILSTINLASIYNNMGNYRLAEEYAGRGLALSMESLGENHRYTALGHRMYGIACVKLGFFDAGFRSFHKNLEILGNMYGYEHPNVASSYNNLGSAYMDIGNYDTALIYYKHALDIREKNHSNPFHIAGSYLNIGAIYKLKGNYQLALSYYQQGLAIQERELGKDNYESTGLYNNIGEIYQHFEQYDLALELYQKNLKITQEAIGEDNPETASCYVNLGNIYGTLKDYDKAKECFEAGINAMKNSVGEFHPITATLYYNLAQDYHENNQTRTAIGLLKTSIKIEEEFYKGNHPRLVQSYNSIAELYIEIEQYDSAQYYLEKSRKANLESRYIETDQMPEVFATLDELEYLRYYLFTAELNYSKYNKTKDINALKNAVIAYQHFLTTASMIRQYFNLEDTKMILLKELSDSYLHAIEATLALYKTTGNKEYLAAAFGFSEDNKSAALLDAIRQSDLQSLSNIPDSIRNGEKKLKNELTALKTQLLLSMEAENETDSLQEKQIIDRYNTTRIAYENLLEDIKIQFPSYMQMVSQDVVTLENIIHALDNSTAMLHYALSDSQLFILVITNKGCDIIKEPVEADFSETIMHYISAITRNRKTEYFSCIPVLFNHLIKPALPFIRDKQKLVIIPDKELLYLPFESLSYPSKDRSNPDDFDVLHYLIHDFEIAYQYSSSLWMLAKTKSESIQENQGKPQKQFIGYAPVFASNTYDIQRLLTRDQVEADTGYRSIYFGDRYFGDLPYTETEVKEIVTLFRNNGLEANGRFFEEANEMNFYLEAKDYRYVHIATHGLINDKHPELSGLLFYSNDSNINATHYYQNDSLREVIATHSLDGVLFTKEVYNLELNADLIVLSACETGSGILSEGEGIMSLTRGFIYAGVPNILFSFWKVGDKSTSDLMYLFYQSVLEGKSYPAALREAKLNLIKDKKTCYPGTWSGFALIGQ